MTPDRPLMNDFLCGFLAVAVLEHGKRTKLDMDLVSLALALRSGNTSLLASVPQRPMNGWRRPDLPWRPSRPRCEDEPY